MRFFIRPRSSPMPPTHRVHAFLAPDFDHELDLTQPEETTMPQADDIILTHLRVENYRGLELLDIDLPPSGVIFSGTRGIGKPG